MTTFYTILKEELKMKRMLSILLVLSVMISILTGCGSGGSKAEYNLARDRFVYRSNYNQQYTRKN